MEVRNESLQNPWRYLLPPSFTETDAPRDKSRYLQVIEKSNSNKKQRMENTRGSRTISTS